MRLFGKKKRKTIDETNIPGWFSQNQLNFLYKLIVDTGAQQCLEIGTYMGRSAYAICAGLSDVGGERLVCIDTFASPLSEEYFKLPFMKNMLSRLPEVVIADYTDVNRFPSTLHCFQHTLERFPMMKSFVEIRHGDSKSIELEIDTFDFALIDGGHEYEEVKTDFENVRVACKRGAIIVFDDCSKYFPGVEKLVDELKAPASGVQFIDQVESAVAVRLI